MVNIIPKKTEEHLNLFFDLDGTLKDHSNLEKKFYKLFIPSSINRKDSAYRKLLTNISNIYAPISRIRTFEDVSGIPKETLKFATNTIYTLNSPRAIKYFLGKSNMANSFQQEISLKAKNSETLANMLREYQAEPENSLAVLIGDTIGDIENGYEGQSISVALGGPLERKQGRLESISDTYIRQEERQNPNLVRYRIYERIEKEMDEIQFSKKAKARKGITNLKNHYESKL